MSEPDWGEEDDAAVCMALWEAGFNGPESAERGPIMMAAKRMARLAYASGRRAGIEEAAAPLEEMLKWWAIDDDQSRDVLREQIRRIRALMGKGGGEP